MSLISLKNVSKTFGRGHTKVRAVKDVNLEINGQDIVLIMGPSGSGKTTLLSMMGALMMPTEGQVLIDDKDMAEMSSSELANLRLKHFGFVFQSFNLLSALSARQNVAVPLITASWAKKKALEKADQLLTELQMEAKRNSLPRDLSGGEKQRVSIARALANGPKLILADEPTANLDSKNGLRIMNLLCEIACNESKAIVIVSHDQRLKAIAKRVIIIEDGQLTKEVKGGFSKN